jgi:RNA polymerase sigma-70 factor (ECF subfamily)
VSIDVLANNPHISRSELSELHDGAWHWAYSQLDRDADAADEVLQNVYVLILEGRARFDNRATLKTWLYGVIRHTCRTYRRSQLRYRLARWRFFTAEQASDNDYGQVKLQDNSHENSELVSARLVQALKALPGRQREVLELHLYRGFSLAECAEVLGLRVGSVRTHYHRAKDNLQRQFTQLGDVDE